MNKKTKIIFISLFLILSFFIFSKTSQAAFFPLEITNIKPAGTGDPAIPSTNRIFRAYPGIEYNIRAAVIGGTYPYTYSLSNQPEGMTINPRTGEISWPNPQSNSGNITLSVTDSESTTVSTTWEIVISNAGFFFIDSYYDGNSTGSFSQPFKTILNMLESVTDKTAIVYFRGGNYALAPFGISNDGPEYAEMADLVERQPTNIGNSPFTWIGYPSETVNVEGWGSIIAGNVYFDNLNFSNFISGHAVRMSSVQNYKTVRRCTFSGISSPVSQNNNQGFLFTRESGLGYYFTIQDNVFSDFTGVAAIGSLYDAPKTLIENNIIHNNGGTSISGINVALAVKDDLDGSSIRGNSIVMASVEAIGAVVNGFMYGTDKVEICFNYFKTTGTSNITPYTTCSIRINTSSFSPERYTTNSYYYRNTIVGDIILAYYDGVNPGKFGDTLISENVIINSNSETSKFWMRDYIGYDKDKTIWTINPWLDFVDIDNLKNTSESALIDANGKLQTDQFAHIGSRGWQLSDGLTPMELSGSTIGAPGSPTGLTIF
ncbi:MAG: Ig domain-containing protein [Candidatus Moraniibacteriota bacterium]